MKKQNFLTKLIIMKYFKFFVLTLFLCGTIVTQAQWDLGIRDGYNVNNIVRSNAGRIDETYHFMPGYDLGFLGRYHFNEWFALRADLSLMSRNYEMRRNAYLLEGVYTVYKNTYLMLPVMADFSINLEKFHIHFMGGVFVGYWLSASRYGRTSLNMSSQIYKFDEDIEFNKDHNRFSAGFVTGAGVEYDLSENWSMQLDAIYYYDLISSFKVSEIAADPRYYNTTSLTLGIIYKF